MMNSLRAAAFLSLVVGSISGLAVGIYQFQRVFAANVAEVRRDALLAVDTVELLVQNIRLAVTTVAANIDPDDLAGSAEVFWQSVKQEWPRLRTMLVIDPSGSIVADLGRDGAAVGTDVSFRDYFLEVISGRETVYYVDAPIISTFDDRWILPVSAPVLDENLGGQGVVTASVEESYFDPTGWQSLGQGSQVYLVSMETGGVAALQPDMPLLGSGESADAAVLEAMRGPEGRLAIPGQTAFGSVASFGSLGVIVSRPSMAIRDLAIRSGAIRGLLVAAAAAFFAMAIFRGKVVLDRLRRDEERFRNLEAQQRLATSAAQIGMWRLDLGDQSLVWDATMYQQYQIAPEDFGGNFEAWRSKIHPEDATRFSSKLEAAIKSEQDFSDQFRILTPTGDERTILAMATITPSSDAQAKSLTGVSLNVTRTVANEKALRTALKRIEKDASIDQLTGIGNRRGFLQHTRRLQNKIPIEETIAVILLDIDEFKSINDVFGHVGGDYLLTVLAKRVESFLGADDYIGRLGGDEFSVILSGSRVAERAVNISNLILESCRNPLSFDERTIRYTASIGVALGPLSSAVRLLEDADIALYEAKRAGRNRLQLFNPKLRARSEDRKHLSDDLRVAISRSQIGIRLQPQVCTRTGSLGGAEVLVRWWHPLKGELSPDQFLPLAADMGLLSEIDAIVMAKAFEAVKILEEHGIYLPSISLNTSLERLISPKLITDVRSYSSYSGTVIFELLEITDFSLVEQQVLGHISKLRNMGICFAVDDFGSGHASLTALIALKPDFVKIDKRIVIEETSDGNSQSPFLLAIVDLCERLNIKVIAEGVETAQSAEILSNLEIEFLQGYYHGRPATVEEFIDWVLSCRPQ
ncbi:bifunctional diguanylate cyclase/phosphodiesterase [Roseicyclus marinus]|uniref:bifunctional diguanylate cyclase/phosphodiesterase n=1 Tax=Roseicyclus marinus TaxID=2161673 RepID=UPI00240F8AC3|nr:EAL domain-containing protein [Roseicyclus marinus]MDG3040478.1 EAL domain-containing protein [Roseicyclus marinus]